MVEATANSIEDFLVDGLSFKLKKGASYVNERKSVTYHPQGSNIYSTSGTKLIKILVSGDNWLDPSTFRVMFDLMNMETDGAKLLRPISGPHSFFKRMRILCNGQIVEDIDDFNRVSEMFMLLTAKDAKKNFEAEGFGRVLDNRDFHNNNNLNATNFKGIQVGQGQTVLFKPLSGLLNQSKYLPLRYCPLTIELELVNDAGTPVISPASSTTGSSGVFQVSNCSTVWQIQNVQAKCDICVLDNSLENSYTEHLLSGRALPINYNTFISQLQNVLSGTNGQQKVRLNVTRALSRLKSVFISLNNMTNASVEMKEWNTFYSPMFNLTDGRYNGYDSGKEFECQLSLGAKLYPEYPLRSHAEAYYQLRKTMGSHSSNVQSFDIDGHEYRDTKMIIGIDMERVLEAGFTGMNTKAGDILNIRFDHKSGTPSEYAHSMHVVMQSDNIMEIRDGGITVFD